MDIRTMIFALCVRPRDLTIREAGAVRRWLAVGSPRRPDEQVLDGCVTQPGASALRYTRGTSACPL